MTSLRGGAAPEASSAVAGSGGIAGSSGSRARWAQASAAAWATAASASGEPSTATRMLRYTLDIVRPSTMIGPHRAGTSEFRTKVQPRRPGGIAAVLHNLTTETEEGSSDC